MALIPMIILLNQFNIRFEDNSTLETKYIIIRESKPENKVKKDLSSELPWNISSEGGELKCLVDEENELNIVFIKSFFVEGDNESKTINLCANLIHSNDYKIVIITQQLWEGDNYPAYYYTQLLFPKIAVKFNMAMKQSDLNKDLYESNNSSFLDARTCRAFKDWDDFIEQKPDKYGDVEHKRSKIYNPFNNLSIDIMNGFRRYQLSLGHNKKATDILILTDTVAYGAASNFMKTVQINGGAIVASYAGNPKINKDTIKTLDASLDPVDSTKYENTTIYKALKEMGFDIYSVPFAESFEMIENNTYPMAFVVNEVDEKTDIYYYYQDTFIDEFIEEAKKIFEKYETKCNPENSNLVLESNTCVFKDDPHAHGGFPCGEKGKWDYTKCKKTHCDFGYFYNKATDKCENDQCIANEIIDINKEEERELKIEPNKQYIVNLNTNLYAYFFQSPVDDILTLSNGFECPRFCAIKENYEFIYINHNLNLENEVTIKIISVEVDVKLQSMIIPSPEFSQIFSVPGPMGFVFKLTEDNYMYIDSYDKNLKFYYAMYDDKMTMNDILNINEEYFKGGLNEFLFLPANYTYIGIFKQDAPAMAKMYMYNSLPETIKLANADMSMLFLEKGKTYQLDFSGNTIPLIIRLNEKTNATLKMIDNTTKIEKTITFTDNYFVPENQPFNGVIEISDIEEDEKGALLELLYSFEKPDIISTEGNYIIQNNVTLIEYNPQEEKKTIQIFIESNEAYYLYAYGGPSQRYYSYYSPEQYITIKNHPIYAIKLDDPLKDFNLDEDIEKYYITLIIERSREN